MPLYPDLLSEDCTDITDWTDGDASTGVSEVDPAGQFRFDTNATANSYVTAERHRTIASPPNQFTIEIKTYFDAIGTYGNGNGDLAAVSYSTETWRFLALFASDGLFITKATNDTEVGTKIVKCNASATWQTWRFQVDKSSGEASATVETFLDGVSQGTVDCDDQADFTGYNGRIGYKQLGTTNPDRISHVNYIKVATGLGIIYGPSTSEFLQLL